MLFSLNCKAFFTVVLTSCQCNIYCFLQLPLNMRLKECISYIEGTASPFVFNWSWHSSFFRSKFSRISCKTSFIFREKMLLVSWNFVFCETVFLHTKLCFVGFVFRETKYLTRETKQNCNIERKQKNFLCIIWEPKLLHAVRVWM